MKGKLLVSIATVAAGLVCSGGYAQASSSAHDEASQPVVIAQNTPSGGSTGGGPTSGPTDPSMPGGNQDMGKRSGSMDTDKTRQGVEKGRGSDSGKGALPGSGSAGSPSGSGSSSSSGPTSGSGSSGMGGSSGGASGGSGGGGK